jgi:predicted AAA+ superfamily ATPase
LSNPVVALLGSRQCGKSTVAKFILNVNPECTYLDLEKASDLAKLNDEWAFFNANRGKLICLDEIQLKPEIFTQIRSFVDEQDTNGQFLILGSASRDIIKQSSESLAGRIAYIEIPPFLRNELFSQYKIRDMHLQGGFPRSILALDLDESFIWRDLFYKIIS